MMAKNPIQFYWQQVKDNKSWLWFVFIWFVVSVVLGARVFHFLPNFLEAIVRSFQDKFGGSPEFTWGLAVQIFLNNLIVALISLVGGVFLGLIPVFMVLTNGALIGYILAGFNNAAALGIFQKILFSVLVLAPHGIFEIPAILLASALGLRLGINWLRTQEGLSKKKIWLSDLKQAAYVLPLVILLLVIAAIMEVFVTPAVAGLVRF